MTQIRNFFRSFQVRVTATIVIALVMVVLVNNAFIYRFALDAQMQQLRNRLISIARIIASNVDVQDVLSVPLDASGTGSRSYQKLQDQLLKFQKLEKDIGFIYILGRTEAPGVLHFVIDVATPVTHRKERLGVPGELYSALRFSDMMQAFDGATADHRLEVDEWGVTLSGYAPIRDQNGKAVAILGVDMFAKEVFLTQRAVHVRALWVLVLGVLLSVFLGMWLSRRITNPVQELISGTRHVSEGDLEYKVSVHGDEEISTLAGSFNKMAEDLSASRQRVNDYFYGVIESLVRIVEAKDPYTRGHSERVAEYAARLAVRMEFSKDVVDLFQRAALLHDIGKLGIPDDVLNKTSKLTGKEWDSIRRHPGIGEEILKPVAMGDGMLAVVREHHERYDGMGYPLGLKGENINIFAQILSVADAYDAMTSTRAYRIALSVPQAIAELENAKGKQFSPVVVDTFVKMISEDPRQGGVSKGERDGKSAGNTSL